MKKLTLAIAAVLLTGTVTAAGAHLAAQETAKADGAGLPAESVELKAAQPAEAETKVRDYADNVLILMKADTCTDEQLRAVLEKYHLTVLQEGSVIPFCTVQLESPLEKAELEALADKIAAEDGILSAMPDYIAQLD